MEEKENPTRGSAIHSLWEKHNAGQRNRKPWPPSEKEIQEEIENVENSQGWDDRAPGG